MQRLRAAAFALALLLACAVAAAQQNSESAADGTLSLVEVDEQQQQRLLAVNLAFLELEELTRDMSEEELRGIVDDVVSKVKRTCGGWINDMRNGLTSTVNTIKSGAESTMNGFVTALNNDVTTYVRTKIVAPFQAFGNKLDSAKNEVQGVINTVAAAALQAKKTLEAAAITIAKFLVNPLSIPDTVQCTPPTFMTGPQVSAEDLQSWCKVEWVADKFGVSGFFGKIGGLISKLAGAAASTAGSFVELHAATGENAHALVQMQERLDEPTCNGLRAAATVLDGLDKSCNLILSALDVQSPLQFLILAITTVFKGISCVYKAMCATNGYF